MGTQRLWGILVVAVCAMLAGGTAARAEVAAEVDFEGKYLRTIVISRATISDLNIWGVVLPRANHVPLNPEGDLSRDLWPVIVESNGRPFVVWSRFTGIDYDLAWSRWNGPGWREVDWIEPMPRSGNDLDPDLTVDETGRPHLAWWTDEGGLGRVYFSMYLDTRWMGAYGVSDPDTDSRDPRITVNRDGSITVEFTTPDGTRSKTIQIISGHSINDDFDPFNSMESKNMKH